MERLKLITPRMPKGIELPPLDFKPPTAGIPSYKPIVIPPSDLEAPEDVKEETTEEVAQPSLKIPVIDIQMPVPEPAVVVTAVTTAVVAVATTSITSSLFDKLKDAAEDQEHQIQILGTFVRLGVVVWSGFIITLNYVEIPMIRKSPGGDITFPASIFTGALATFGLTTGSNGNGNKKDKSTTK